MGSLHNEILHVYSDLGEQLADIDKEQRISDREGDSMYLLEYLDVDPSTGKVMFPNGIDLKETPFFTTHDVAFLFFQSSLSWLRRMQVSGMYTSKSGVTVEPQRGSGLARLYTLTDIEQLANTFYEHGAIDFGKWRSVMYILFFIGTGYRVLL